MYSVSNHQLSEQIIVLAKEKLSERAAGDVEKICLSESFKANPISHMLLLIIKRGIHGARSDDGPRRFIIKQIPLFINTVTDLDYLMTIGKDELNGDLKVLAVFQKSIRSGSFQTTLDEIKDYAEEGDFSSAEKTLRGAMQVFSMAKEYKEYEPVKNGEREE